MASLYSDGSIYLPGSKDPQGPAGTGHCHCVGLVWAPEVLETCLGILGIWHLSQESTDRHGSGRECGRAPLGLLLPRNPWLFWCRSWWAPSADHEITLTPHLLQVTGLVCLRASYSLDPGGTRPADPTVWLAKSESFPHNFGLYSFL